MKKIDLPLWSDTLFLFICCFLLSFCALRYFLRGLWLCLVLAAVIAVSCAILLHLLLRRRRQKRHAAEQEREKVAALAFHLALDSPAHNAARIAECLNAQDDRAAPFRAVNGRAVSDCATVFPLFRFERVTADDLVCVLRDASPHKTVWAGGFTDEARKLADTFELQLKDATQVYALLQDSGCLPETMLAPPTQKTDWRTKLRFRLRRESWRGYAFSGAFLLLFSLLTVFPLYYILSGGLLLSIAVLIRFFGKKSA